ncbi:hypothetical protein EDB87DRAFT_1579820 [Lactarius vividus]|nr:hypothetical protein EDB87DRAFT_1579820 [Lactarius vividus]
MASEKLSKGRRERAARRIIYLIVPLLGTESKAAAVAVAVVAEAVHLLSDLRTGQVLHKPTRDDAIAYDSKQEKGKKRWYFIPPMQRYWGPAQTTRQEVQERRHE